MSIFYPHQINDLPSEVLLHIMRQLSHDDICNAYQVCNRWHVIAEDKSLWEDYRLTVKLVNEENIDVFSTRPYKKVKSICVQVWDNNLLSSILAPKLFSELLTNGVEMKELCFKFRGKNSDFSAVPVDDFVKVVKYVKELIFVECGEHNQGLIFSENQLNGLFKSLEQEPSNLNHIEFNSLDITSANAISFANGSSNLPILYLEGSKVTDSQLICLFSALERDSCKLVSLVLTYIDITSVNATSLANGGKRLSRLDFESLIMSNAQLKALLSTLAATEDNIEEASVLLFDCKTIGGDNIMANLLAEDVDHLVTLIDKVYELWMDYNAMSNSNLSRFISALSKKSLKKLTNLDLSICDFSSVNIKDLSVLLCKLSEVNMDESKITSEQVASLFWFLARKVALKQCNLSWFSVERINLSRVNVCDLIEVITKLRSVYLADTRLSHKQSKMLLDAIVKQPDVKLQSMNVGKIDVFKGLPRVLIDAVKIKKNIQIYYCEY